MKYPVQRFFIFTENDIISKEIKQPGRAMFYPGPRNILKAFIDRGITEAARNQLMEELEIQYDVPALAHPTKPKDEFIFELPSFGKDVNHIIEYTDELIEQYDKPFRIADMLKWYTFKAITDVKFPSKFIKLKDQVSLVDIKDIRSDNENGISLVTTEESYDYLKDNIHIITKQFKESSLKTLDIYSLIQKPIEEAEGMVEKSLTKFELAEGDRKLSLMTYPSTDVSITVVEVS